MNHRPIIVALVIGAAACGGDGDTCHGNACKSARMDLDIEASGTAPHSCTIVLSSSVDTMWSSASIVRATMERRGHRAAIAAVASSGGVLLGTLGSISVPSSAVRESAVVSTECFDDAGALVSGVSVTLREVQP